MVNTIVWVIFGLTVAAIAGYATNTMGFRDYIDAYLHVFSQYNSNRAFESG